MYNPWVLGAIGGIGVVIIGTIAVALRLSQKQAVLTLVFGTPLMLVGSMLVLYFVYYQTVGFAAKQSVRQPGSVHQVIGVIQTSDHRSLITMSDGRERMYQMQEKDISPAQALACDRLEVNKDKLFVPYAANKETTFSAFFRR